MNRLEKLSRAADAFSLSLGRIKIENEREHQKLRAEMVTKHGEEKISEIEAQIKKERDEFYEQNRR